MANCIWQNFTAWSRATSSSTWERRTGRTSEQSNVSSDAQGYIPQCQIFSHIFLLSKTPSCKTGALSILLQIHRVLPRRPVLCTEQVNYSLSTQQQILLIQSVSQQDFFWVKAHIKVQYSSRMCGSWQAKLQPNIVHLAVILFTQLLCSLQQPVVRNSSGTPKRRDFLQQPHSASQTMPIVKWAERRFGASQRTGLCFQFMSDWLQTFPVKPHSAVSDGSSISDNDYYLNVYKSTRHLSHE